MKLKPGVRWFGRLTAVLLGITSLPAGSNGSIAPNEWKFEQTVNLPGRGLFRVDLPVEALDAARSDLADLRIVAPDGLGVPYLIDRPRPKAEALLQPGEFRTEVLPSGTRILLTTGTKALIAGVAVTASSDNDFIKAVRVEGSHDGSKWRLLIDGQPIFKMGTGASRLRVLFGPASWEFLRLTVDDTRTAQVPFIGAELITPASSAPVDALPIVIKSHDENPNTTRVALDLGGSNLTVASLRLETADPLFMRRIAVAVPELDGDTVVEKTVGTGVVYRVELNGKIENQLEIPVEAQVRGRELIVLIHNGDSPPLPIKTISAERRLTRVLFFARDPGQYRLLYGNRACHAPEYDLSGIGTRLKTAAATELHVSPLTTNPEYKVPDDLGSLPLTGTNIDVANGSSAKRSS